MLHRCAGLSHLSATPSFHLWTMLTRHAKKDTKITLKIEFAYVSVRVCVNVIVRARASDSERQRERERERERLREIERD